MPDFKPGQTVLLSDGRKATVRFVGQTSFQVGDWIGVELEDKTGKNDGSVQGIRYFDCPAGYGMFVKPVMATIVAQPPTTKPARKPARPSSFAPAAIKTAISGDVASAKRRSLNAPSPSPIPKARPTSLVRSPTKSPTKQLNASSSTTSSRTGTPSNGRGPPASAGAGPAASRARASTTSHRMSMGPPPVPLSRTARVYSVSSAAPKTAGAHTRPMSVARQLGSLRSMSRADSRPRHSIDSQTGRDSGSPDDTSPESPTKSDSEILSPQPKSPVAGRAKALERMTAQTSPRESSTTPPVPKRPAAAPSQRSFSNAAAANREIEDLKAKLKVLERKRSEDRDKLNLLDKVQSERDKFEGIIQKLQQKYQPQQQENADLRKQLKEAEAKFESIEAMQAEHDTALELAALDREMAEETAEVLKMEVDALKQKSEELELEVEVLREENLEYSKGMTPEDRASTGWLQMERTNERLREALIRLRDLTQAQEEELRDQIVGLEEDVKELGKTKQAYESAKEKLAQSEAAVDDLRQQLDTALGAEDMIEDLTERNMSMSEQLEELKAVVADLESLKEINDELEANHVQNEKEMQEELDFKDSVITEQARRAGQQEEAFEDMEYTVSRFRELVTNLQSDLEDMRASQAVTEGESEKLNDRSRAMMDLNMKLQISAAKAQVKTIDLELRRLDAQEADQHLEIVKLFLPDTYQEDRDSVLALLRFRRLSFKANLLNGFIRERINDQAHAGHEDDILAGCDAVDKLVWVSAMCDRFVNDMSHCAIEQFSKYQHSLLELEPVERTLNAWIDGLRRDELKEKKCADDLQRTIALMSHLAEVHISNNLPSLADEMHMSSLMVQSHLDMAAISFNTMRSMVQRAIAAPAAEGESDEEMSQLLAKKLELAITQTRSTKVIAGKAVRALEDLKTRSLSLYPDSKDIFERCESASQELASMVRAMGNGLHALLTQDEGRSEPFTADEVERAIHQGVVTASSADSMDSVAAATWAGESDTFSAYLNKLHRLTAHINEATALATDLDQTQEFDVHPAPWKLRSQALLALKTVPVDAEEELRRLKEEHNEARRTIAQRDEHLSTAVLKIETLESRMRDAHANIERISDLQRQLETADGQVTSLKEDIEKQDRELKSLETERDKWKKIASDSRAYADGADAAGMKAGQERAVATAREMDALRKDVESLQSAVRYLREDNRRARMTEQQNCEWLLEPLKKPAPMAEQRKALLLAEGKDVLGELVRMTASATMFTYAALPKDRLAWKPAKTTPQYHAAKQMEDYTAWKAWQDSVVKKSSLLRSTQEASDKAKGRRIRNPAAQLRIRLPGPDGKMMTGSGLGRNVEIVGSRAWEAMQSTGVAA
ncbi:hypothetical protein E4U42_007409 [Claviceps africana]|uniref:CAP-Gly domain-containing protein n=1 Tax=Claviceps africana TaxID=83212 RepID=A0A8K0NIJ8_9HYPO|nr:hypothetical protein E4U42_007409 [Claviceps africana]